MGERRSISRWTISRQLAVAEPQAVELRAEVAVAEAERVQVVAAEAERVQVVAAEAVQARLQVREHLPQADVAQQPARLQLLPFLSPQELLRPQQQVRRVQAAAVAPKQVVAVDGVDRAAEVAVAVVADRPLEEIARAPQFPAWRSSMRCLQRAPIPMWRSVRAVRKPALAAVFQIRC
jgi:hypothetical protein